jgi:hypothetical protein
MEQKVELFREKREAPAIPGTKKEDNTIVIDDTVTQCLESYIHNFHKVHDIIEAKGKIIEYIRKLE